MSVVRFPVERRQAQRKATEPKQLLTLRELCQAVRMSERWVRYRCAEGMPAHRWGNRLRFDLDEVNAWMDERRSDGQEAG